MYLNSVSIKCELLSRSDVQEWKYRTKSWQDRAYLRSEVGAPLNSTMGDFIPRTVWLCPLFEMLKFKQILPWLVKVHFDPFIKNVVVIKTKNVRMQKNIQHFGNIQLYQSHSESFSGSLCHHWWSEVVFLFLRVAVRDACTLHSKLLRALQPGPIPDNVEIKLPQRSFTISPPCNLRSGKRCANNPSPTCLPWFHAPVSQLSPLPSQTEQTLEVYHQSNSEPVSWEGWGEEGGTKEGKRLEKHGDRCEKC